MEENDISYLIRGGIFKVYNNLGPGLLESAYEAALSFELIKADLNVKTQVMLPMIYETIKMDNGYRLDLLVENKVIIEFKISRNTDGCPSQATNHLYEAFKIETWFAG